MGRALDKILQSPAFASSQQLSDFLRYIVTKTIKGKAYEIKAYSIAVDALGKGEDFDLQENAAVRVAAGRLRQALTLHNAELSRSNPELLITLEIGSHVPIFVRSASQPAMEQPDKAGDAASRDEHSAGSAAVYEQPRQQAIAPRKGGNSFRSLADFAVSRIRRTYCQPCRCIFADVAERSSGAILAPILSPYGVIFVT